VNALGHQRPLLLAVFLITYVGIAVGHVPRLKLNRAGIALLGAIAVMVLSGSSTLQTVEWINWPTLLLLFGFFVLSAQLCLSGFYGRIAEYLSRGSGSPRQFLLVLMATTAGLSAFVNHDIVCYIFTPVVGLALAHRRLNPVPFLIGLALASNIGAAATLIGNAQGILIAESAHLSFLGYLLWSFVPVAGALSACYGIVAWSLPRWSTRGSFANVDATDALEYPFDRRHAVKGMVIFAVVIALCFTSLPKEWIVLVAAGIHLASPKFRTEDLLALVDWPLLVLFVSLFVITGALQSTGYAEQAVRWLEGVGFSPILPGNEVLLTAGTTALMNNAPAVMLLLKIIPVSHPTTAYLMALSNSFGGSVFLTASVSNLIVVQQARQHGIVIGFRDFARLGVPVALVSLAILAGWATLIG
jgi:Na+/H+ antiporter NhaD/arsenite permease-like protein